MSSEIKYFQKPICYLQASDFDSSGNITNKNIPRNIPVVIMALSNHCGYCTVAKPAFDEFANSYKEEVFCACIQADGNEPGEAELAGMMQISGFPEYILYRNGKRVAKEITGRDVQQLKEYANI